MGELIKFPERRRNVLNEDDVTVSFEEPPNTCVDYIHIFDEIPGRCRCGERTWEKLPEPEIGIHEVS